MAPLTGMRSIMTSSPAKTLGPSWNHSKVNAKMICIGEDQIMFRYG